MLDNIMRAIKERLKLDDCEALRGRDEDDIPKQKESESKERVTAVAGEDKAGRRQRRLQKIQDHFLMDLASAARHQPLFGTSAAQSTFFWMNDANGDSGRVVIDCNGGSCILHRRFRDIRRAQSCVFKWWEWNCKRKYHVRRACSRGAKYFPDEDIVSNNRS